MAAILGRGLIEQLAKQGVISEDMAHHVSRVLIDAHHDDVVQIYIQMHGDKSLLDLSLGGAKIKVLARDEPQDRQTLVAELCASVAEGERRRGVVGN